MTITISQTRVACINESQRQDSYVALNARGKGKAVATINGAERCDLGFGCDGALVDGQQWSLSDALAMAQRGERGLSLVDG